jgi:acyl-homoserine lactone synthase
VHLCNDRLVRDPRAAEWTRGFVVPGRREGLGVRLKAAFCWAVMEWCLEQGVTRIGGIQDEHWLALWRRFGWRVEITGRRAQFGAEWWVPAYFDVSEAAAAGARRWAKLDHSILVERGTIRPFVPVTEEPVVGAAAATEINVEVRHGL